MRTYRCKCGNLQLRKEGEEMYPPSGEEGSQNEKENENGRSPTVVVRGGKVELVSDRRPQPLLRVYAASVGKKNPLRGRRRRKEEEEGVVREASLS